jgi:hypothetical protein
MSSAPAPPRIIYFDDPWVHPWIIPKRFGIPLEYQYKSSLDRCFRMNGSIPLKYVLHLTELPVLNRREQRSISIGPIQKMMRIHERPRLLKCPI